GKPAADFWQEVDAADGAWVQLFNGKDLQGWKVFPSGVGNWKVVKGHLTCSGPQSHLFSERDDFDDFHFRVEVKINDGGNSGQYFRARFKAGYPNGYEAEINSTHSDPIRTGSLCYFVNIKEMLVAPDTWFTQEVIAAG